MKLSDETLTVLKNFSAINPNIMFRPGNLLRTLSTTRTVMAEAKIQEEIEESAGIYDLSRFLGTLSLFKEPEIEFGAKAFRITEGRSVVSYTYAAEEMILTPPEGKSIPVPNPEIVARVEWARIQSVLKASGVMQLPHIAFTGDGTALKIQAFNAEDPTADTYSVEVEAEDIPDHSFRFVFNMENFKLLPKDYKISISSKNGVSKFENPDITYWVPSESKYTKFGG